MKIKIKERRQILIKLLKYEIRAVVSMNRKICAGVSVRIDIDRKSILCNYEEIPCKLDLPIDNHFSTMLV